MNRMDCFRRQPSEFHYGSNTRLMKYDTYPATHEKIISVIDSDWVRMLEIRKAIPKKNRPSDATIRRHLADAVEFKEIETRIKGDMTQWRRG